MIGQEPGAFSGKKKDGCWVCMSVVRVCQKQDGGDEQKKVRNKQAALFSV
jgi:hypothetical protein